MGRKSIMIDMDEVIVKCRFSDFIDEFLGGVSFNKLNGYYRQDLIKGREKEFAEIYQHRSLYKTDDGEFLNPFPNCIETLKKLSKYYDIYVVTSYVWIGEVINAASNLKHKYEYLEHFLDFIDCNNFIFTQHKTNMKFDIGIDDRPQNLLNCDKRLLFTEFRNEKLLKEELEKDNIIRVDNWLEVEKILLNEI